MSTVAGLDAFVDLRGDLFGLAYRMTGSAADAEDVLQEAYLRWSRQDAGEVRNPKAYLTTIVTRLCIDTLTSARARREQYVGPWLPEPLVVDDDPAVGAEMADSLSLAFLVLLEELSPAERAAFLLHDVFGVAYEEIAEALRRSQAACRQLVHRARQHVAARRRRFDADRARAGELTARFARACATRDVDALVALLAEDAVAWTDGGGKAKAAPRPVVGAGRVARFLSGISRDVAPEASVHQLRLNGQPGLVISLGDEVRVVVVLDIEEGRITGVRIVVNPEKLGAVARALMGRPDAGVAGAR
jgi:RNA polymerase sigma-70 factor (ECF subfamily)